jgi:hypothetical protein
MLGTNRPPYIVFLVFLSLYKHIPGHYLEQAWTASTQILSSSSFGIHQNSLRYAGLNVARDTDCAVKQQPATLRDPSEVNSTVN